MIKKPNNAVDSLLKKIEDHIKSCYVLGEDGRLHPTFKTPRRDESIVSAYRHDYAKVIAGHCLQDNNE